MLAWFPAVNGVEWSGSAQSPGFHAHSAPHPCPLPAAGCLVSPPSRIRGAQPLEGLCGVDSNSMPLRSQILITAAPAAAGQVRLLKQGRQLAYKRDPCQDQEHALAVYTPMPFALHSCVWCMVPCAPVVAVGGSVLANSAFLELAVLL